MRKTLLRSLVAAFCLLTMTIFVNPYAQAAGSGKWGDQQGEIQADMIAAAALKAPCFAGLRSVLSTVEDLVSFVGMSPDSTMNIVAAASSGQGKEAGNKIVFDILLEWMSNAAKQLRDKKQSEKLSKDVKDDLLKLIRAMLTVLANEGARPSPKLVLDSNSLADWQINDFLKVITILSGDFTRFAEKKEARKLEKISTDWQKIARAIELEHDKILSGFMQLDILDPAKGGSDNPFEVRDVVNDKDAGALFLMNLLRVPGVTEDGLTGAKMKLAGRVSTDSSYYDSYVDLKLVNDDLNVRLIRLYDDKPSIYGEFTIPTNPEQAKTYGKLIDTFTGVDKETGAKVIGVRMRSNMRNNRLYIKYNSKGIVSVEFLFSEYYDPKIVENVKIVEARPMTELERRAGKYVFTDSEFHNGIPLLRKERD